MAQKQVQEDQVHEDQMELPGSGRWWRRSAHAAPPPGLGERVIKILRLAEEEADELREEARRAAAAIIEQAERDAARIRADAEAEARAIRAGAGEEQL